MKSMRGFNLRFGFVHHRDVNVCILFLNAHSRVSVNDVGKREISSYRLDVLDSVLAEMSFENARDKVGHNDIAFTT